MSTVFFNQYINPIAIEHLSWKYYIFYDVWLAIELVVVYFFYIETRNTPLEEIAKHFDGDAAVIGGGAATDKGLRLAAEAGMHQTIVQTKDMMGDRQASVTQMEKTETGNQ